MFRGRKKTRLSLSPAAAVRASFFFPNATRTIPFFFTQQGLVALSLALIEPRNWIYADYQTQFAS